jgi:hypothetical protein
MRKIVIKKILNKLPDDYANTDFIFYNRKFNHVMTGFAMDASPNTVRVYKYFMPLFIRNKRLHLSYSEILSQTDRSFLDGDNDLVNFFLNEISEYLEEMEKYSDLDYYANYLAKTISSHLDNANSDISATRIRYCYAMALALLGSLSDAKHQIDEIIRSYGRAFSNKEFDFKIIVSDVKENSRRLLFERSDLPAHELQFIEDVYELKDALTNSDQAAVELAEKYEYENKLKFGLMIGPP